MTAFHDQPTYGYDHPHRTIYIIGYYKVNYRHAVTLCCSSLGPILSRSLTSSDLTPGVSLTVEDGSDDGRWRCIIDLSEDVNYCKNLMANRLLPCEY